MPDWMSRERVQLIRCLGAEVVPITREQGGFLGSIRLCEEFAAHNPHVFLPRQFSNCANITAHYNGTGPEIWAQLEACGLRPGAFVAGVGTGGTVMGTGRFLRERNPRIAIHPVEPLESPTLSTGHKVGTHRIQGISDDFIPDLINFTQLNEVISISDGDSILMAQKIASQLLAALRAQDLLAPSAIVVTVFCDDNKKYLTTDLLGDEPARPGYLTPEITMLGFHSYPRCY
jgi:cysteine synthase A